MRNRDHGRCLVTIFPTMAINLIFQLARKAPKFCPSPAIPMLCYLFLTAQWEGGSHATRSSLALFLPNSKWTTHLPPTEIPTHNLASFQIEIRVNCFLLNYAVTWRLAAREGMCDRFAFRSLRLIMTRSPRFNSPNEISESVRRFASTKGADSSIWRFRVVMSAWWVSQMDVLGREIVKC